MDHEAERRALFEAPTPDDETGFVGRLRRDIIMQPRVALRGTTIVITDEAMVAYSELPAKHSLLQHLQAELSLNITRGCLPQDNIMGNFPSIACNRLVMQEHAHFPEPLRDRDKVYMLEKAAILASYSPTHDPLDPPDSSAPAVALGKYAPNPQIPPFYWSSAFQSLIRKQRLLRCFRCISESYCVVDVYGIGITGRVFSEGSNSGRMIVIEAYSHWNSEKHVVLLPFVELRQLLLETGHEGLFRPGRKEDLVRKLVDGLVFRYTVSAEALPHEGRVQVVPAAGAEDQAGVEGGQGPESDAPDAEARDDHDPNPNPDPDPDPAQSVDPPHSARSIRSVRSTRSDRSVRSVRSVRSDRSAAQKDPPATPSPPSTPPLRGPYSLSITHIAPLTLPLPYPQTISALMRLHAHTQQIDGKTFFTPEPLPATADASKVHKPYLLAPLPRPFTFYPYTHPNPTPHAALHPPPPQPPTRSTSTPCWSCPASHRSSCCPIPFPARQPHRSAGPASRPRPGRQRGSRQSGWQPGSLFRVASGGSSPPAACAWAQGYLSCRPISFPSAPAWRSSRPTFLASATPSGDACRPCSRYRCSR